MNTKSIRFILLAVALVAANISPLRAADSAKEVGAMAINIFDALEKDDFEKFLADADNTWRRIQKSDFEKLSAQLGTKMKGGYQLVSLGEIKRSGGIRQTLWKLILNSDGEEIFATIDIREGKVAGFRIPRI